jgi:hypothetical protein
MSLHDDLAAWAASVRLTDAEAEAIFQRVPFQSPGSQSPGFQSTGFQSTGFQSTGFQSTGAAVASKAARKAARPRTVAFPAAPASVTALSAPAGLAPSWWRDYTKGFAARMVTATRPVTVAA